MADLNKEEIKKAYQKNLLARLSEINEFKKRFSENNIIEAKDILRNSPFRMDDSMESLRICNCSCNQAIQPSEQVYEMYPDSKGTAYLRSSCVDKMIKYLPKPI